MEFAKASTIESITWQMRLADYPRSLNRSRINDLFNGVPPYTPDEEAQNNIAVNVNFLEGLKLAHDARGQFANAFQTPANYFTLRTDMGPVHKRMDRGTIVTTEMNRAMKRSLPYLECQRSKFALNVLHGIGPSAWHNCESWCPSPLGVEDVLIPSNTKLTMENLPFFAIYRNYTAEELHRAAYAPHADPGWQKPVVDAAIKWADTEAGKLIGNTWPEVWSPEKMSERMKEDGGLFASDAVPTISAWDFYWWNDSNDVQGWNRRIVLDAFGQPGVSGIEMPTKNMIGGRNQFLYNPGKKKYGSKLGEIIHWQFADLSAVAPARYHSVRSLGFLLYSVCHLQNRLRCKFNEAVFENLMMYLRVRSSDELERALKINLISRGIIDETVQFLPPAERWQVNQELAAMGMMQNQGIINENSSSYVQNQNYSNPNVEKTKFQVQAELSATTQLISASLSQAYSYEKFEYYEISRRFFIKDSRDPDVRGFQLSCLKKGIPEKMMVAECWDLEPERVVGSGNKSMEMAIANQLMQWRPLYDPDSQRIILKSATLAVTSDAAFASAVVPDKKTEVSQATHDGQLAAGALMAGIPVAPYRGELNIIDYTEALLGSMAAIVQRIEKTGGMATMQEIVGLQNLGKSIAQYIKLISQNPEEQRRVQQYSTDLGNLMNLVKAYQQRLQEKMQKEEEEKNVDPVAMAKIQIEAKAAEQRLQLDQASHAQRSQMDQQKFIADEQRKQQSHQMDLARNGRASQQEIALEDAATGAEIRGETAKTRNEITLERQKAQNQIELDEEKAQAEIARKNKLAEAQAKATAKTAAAKPKPTAKPKK